MDNTSLNVFQTRVTYSVGRFTKSVGLLHGVGYVTTVHLLTWIYKGMCTTGINVCTLSSSKLLVAHAV